MNQLQATVRLKIHDGKLNDFKEIAAQSFTLTKEKDPNTLQYDWFFDENHTECVVRERYADSDAALAHMTNIGDLFGKIMQVADFSLEVYGEPSEELLKAIAPMKSKVYSFYQGL